MEKTGKPARKYQFTDFYCVWLEKNSFCSERSVGEVLKKIHPKGAHIQLVFVQAIQPDEPELQAVKPLLIFFPTLARKIQRLVVSC